jgi:hypothetical protein
MADRNRIRVGRGVTYFPSDVEAAAGNGNAGDQWAATITAVNPDGSANLNVLEADGGMLAKTDVSRGQQKGQFDVRGLAAIA